MDRHEGGCHCGRVQFTTEGLPMQSVFCHCSTCRLSSGAPFVMVGFWPPERTRITAGEPLLARATSTWLTRFRCPDCGAAIYNQVRGAELVSNNFLLALLRARDAAVMPTHHIYYAERIVDVDDRLPRFDGWTWL